jgi:hypothetical protein
MLDAKKDVIKKNFLGQGLKGMLGGPSQQQQPMGGLFGTASGPNPFAALKNLRDPHAQTISAGNDQLHSSLLLP